ncbi:MAG: hypothetical protein WC569_05120 [Candidatus Omnitrophota bacterium]
MAKILRLALILLVIATVASSALAVISFMGKEREYMKRLLLEDKLAATLKEKRDMEKDLEGAKGARQELEAKLAKTESRIKEITSQFEGEREKSEMAVSDLELKKKDLERLKVDLENEKKEKLSISKKLQDIQSDYDKVKKEVSRLASEKSTLERKVSELEQKSVNLDKIVVSPMDDAGQAAAPRQARSFLQGKVLVVNRDYSFVVTDLGQDKGVQKGMIFEVRDGEDLLGKAEIDKVYDTMSSASVLPGGRISDMKKGNLIIESR